MNSLRKLLAFTLGFLTIISPAALALSSNQTDIYNIGIHFFDSEPGNGSGTCTSTGGDTTLVGSDQVEQAFNFFVSKGLTAQQSAGIVGNFKWESGVDPTKIEGGGDSPTPPAGKHWGIAQWDPDVRVVALEKYSQDNGFVIGNLSTQLNFSWFEFNGTLKPALADLQSQTTVEGAALSVFSHYEIALDNTGPSRVSMAQGIYNLYSGNTSPPSQTSPGSSCTSSSSGGTQFIDGFTIYSQYDPRWANDPYGSSTIAASGCGPSAMAMIITNLTGQSVTPDLTASYAGDQGLYIPGAGSSWSIAPVLAQHWGLNSSAIGSNANKVTQTLQNGGLVIGSGQGPLPFTAGGHYIVIRGIAPDGNWLIGDSAHQDTSSQEWNPQQLLSSMNSGSVYAITK